MSDPTKKKKIIASIENTSVMRKFTILFLLMSILPLGVLWYLYQQIKTNGSVNLSVSQLNMTLMWVVFGVAVGFFAVRAMFKKLVELTNANREALKEVLDKKDLEEMKGEGNEIKLLTQSFDQITSRLKENVKSLELAQKTLHSVMAKVGQGITSMQNIDSFLELIIETVTDAVKGKVGLLMLLEEDDNLLWIKAVKGVEYDLNDPIGIRIDKSPTIAAVVKSKKAVVVPKLSSGGDEFGKYHYLFEEPLICAPLMMKNKVRGVITVSGKSDSDNYTDEEMNLLNNLASQTAVAIENSRLSENIEKTYFETISALALAVEAKDKYSRGHLDRVARACIKVGKIIGLDDDEINILRDGAKLHDLGKIGIPDEVLGKSSPLSEEEWMLMHKHTEIGEGIIKPIKSLNNLCDLIRHHHEKLDGSGYPDGIKGDQITPLVRILTVVDIYDALTTSRPYREKFTKGQALSELKKMTDKIDQDVVSALIESLGED